MVVSFSKKARRLSWEMSDQGVSEGFSTCVGIEVLVGVRVGSIDVGVEVLVGVEAGSIEVGAAVQAESTTLDTSIAAKNQEPRPITLSQHKCWVGPSRP